MTDTHYSSSFLITVSIYTLFGLLFLSFSDEIKPLKKTKPKPQVVRIALVSPVTTKAKEKIKKVEIKKPKPKKKKKIIKKKVIKKKVIKKKIRKKKIRKKKIIKKKIVKKVVKPKVIERKPPPPPKKIVKPREIPPPIIEEYIIPDTFKTPVYEPPPPPPPIVYSEMPPEEIYYEPKPVYVSEPIPTAKAKVAQQRYIIHDPLPVQQSAPISAPPAPQTHAVQSDFSSEKNAFKRSTRDIINSNKRYPTMAKRRHIQGTVHVVFDILSSGDITNIRTSGASTILQKSARKSVMESSPLNVPYVLQSQFPMNNVSVNIDFRLE